MKNLLICICLCLVPGCNQVSKAQDDHQFELKNGLTVMLLPLPSATKNTLVVLYDVGNANDPADKSGMAHLAEHLYVTAATENTRSRNVQEYMSAYPDGWNAQTGDDYTVIATVFNADRIDDEISDAADRMQKIKVDQSDLDRELPRIDVELRNMYEGFPPLAVSNLGRHYARPLANDGRRGGRIEELESVTVDEMQSWLDQYYKPANATLILAGAFDAEKTRKRIEEKFGGIEQGRSPSAAPLPKTGQRRVFEVGLKAVSPNPQKRVGFTFNAPDVNDPLYPAFLVHVTRMQLGAMKQRTNMQDIPFMFRPLDDPGFFYASVSMQEGESSEAALKRLETLITEHTETGLKQHHVKSTLTNMALFLGTSEIPPGMMAMNTYGAAFARGRRHQLGMNPEKLKEQFEKIDASQMRQAAEKFLSESNRIAVIGNPTR